MLIPRFEPGDVVKILPRNLRENAIEFVQALNLDPNMIVDKFVPANPGKKQL